MLGEIRRLCQLGLSPGRYNRRKEKVLIIHGPHEYRDWLINFYVWYVRENLYYPTSASFNVTARQIISKVMNTAHSIQEEISRIGRLSRTFDIITTDSKGGLIRPTVGATLQLIPYWQTIKEAGILKNEVIALELFDDAVIPDSWATEMVSISTLGNKGESS